MLFILLCDFKYEKQNYATFIVNGAIRMVYSRKNERFFFNFNYSVIIP